MIIVMGGIHGPEDPVSLCLQQDRATTIRLVVGPKPRERVGCRWRIVCVANLRLGLYPAVDLSPVMMMMMIVMYDFFFSVPWTPFMDHLKEAWKLRHHPNLLFIFYEDMIKV